jgi:hypothetical protein
VKLDHEDSVSTGDRWRLWFLIWAVAVVAMASRGRPAIFSAPLFPLGLIAFLPDGEQKAITAWMLGYPALLGWGFYIFFSILLFRVRKNWLFFLLYGLFCIVLLLNVAGCKRVLDAGTTFE